MAEDSEHCVNQTLSTIAARARTEPTNSIVHPHYACAIGAAHTVSAIPRAIPISNCGPGCADKQFNFISAGNGYQGAGYSGGGSIPSTNMCEQDVVFGGIDKLDKLIKSSLKIMDGDLFVVLTGCIGELIGDDAKSVVKKYQERGKPIVSSQVAGFRGNNVIGHEIVVADIIDQFVGDYEGKKEKGLVNLLCEVPYYNSHWRGDYLELKRIIEGAGLRVNMLFGSESKGVSEWKTIPSAQFNLVLSPWVGLSIAEHLKEKYGQPYLHIPVIPIGEEATSAFIRRIVEYAGVDKKPSETFITGEAARYYYFLEHFAEFFSEFWFGLPATFATVADASTNIAITKFLSDQMGLIPVKQIITDNPPEKYRDDITKLFAELSEGVSVEPLFLEDGYIIENEVRDAPFGATAPLILGSSWESDVAREMKGLSVGISAPLNNELIVNKTFIGYTGALALIERIYSLAVGDGK